MFRRKYKVRIVSYTEYAGTGGKAFRIYIPSSAPWVCGMWGQGEVEGSIYANEICLMKKKKKKIRKGKKEIDLTGWRMEAKGRHVNS